MASLSEAGTLVTALTIAAVLVLPGPTNSLLFLAGTRHGLIPSAALVVVELLGYLAAIVFWHALLAAAGALTAQALAIVRAFSAAYVTALAIRTWRQAPAPNRAPAAGIGKHQLFCATLLNPKAFFFAAFVFPAASAGGGAFLQACLLFSLLLIPIGSGWVAFGTALAGRSPSAPRQALIQHGVALVLLIFSVSMWASLLVP